MAEVKTKSKSNKNFDNVVKYNGILSIIMIVGFFIFSLAHMDSYSKDANPIAYFFERFSGFTLSTIVGVGIYYGTKNMPTSKRNYAIALLIVNCISTVGALVFDGLSMIDGGPSTSASYSPQLASLPWILWSVNVFIPIIILFANKIFAPFREK